MPALTAQEIALIHMHVDNVFARLKTRFLGPKRGALSIAYQFQPSLSLPGLFTAANQEEGNASPDKDLLRSLLRVAESHIEAQRDTTKANVVRTIDAFCRGKRTPDTRALLSGQLADVWKKTAESVKKIIDTEGTTVRNAGALDGITKVNASFGIEDPIIYFVVVRDNLLCTECRRLHLMSDGITPRLWRTSEIGHGYHKKGDSFPKIGGTHINCRCSIVTLMPGYGFDGAGMVVFIDPQHDEYAKQRS